MKKSAQLKEFQIWLPTELGVGLIMKKATSFTDAYLKLCKKYRMKKGWIYDENDECKTFNEILGIEEE